MKISFRAWLSKSDSSTTRPTPNPFRLRHTSMMLNEMIMTTCMLRRDTFEQLPSPPEKNYHTPLLPDQTLYLHNRVRLRSQKAGIGRRLLAYCSPLASAGDQYGMALFDSAIFWFGFALAGEEAVALHSTIPFYLAFVCFSKRVCAAKGRSDMCKALYGFFLSISFVVQPPNSRDRRFSIQSDTSWHRFS